MGFMDAAAGSFCEVGFAFYGRVALNAVNSSVKIES
jgi:hypothetical protein